MDYSYGLLRTILPNRVHIPKNANAKAIIFEETHSGCAEFDAGAATKYGLNPNGYLDGT